MVEIGTDASPYGMGGWLTIDGTLTNYFATDISDEDELIYGCPRGTSKGQQLWEVLAILVAVDIWVLQWQQQRIVLKIRGDKFHPPLAGAFGMHVDLSRLSVTSNPTVCL